MGKIKVTMHYFIVYRALSIIYGSYEYGTEKGQDDPAGIYPMVPLLQTHFDSKFLKIFKFICVFNEVWIPNGSSIF